MRLPLGIAAVALAGALPAALPTAATAGSQGITATAPGSCHPPRPCGIVPSVRPVTIGNGARTCTLAPKADCHGVAHRWKAVHHGNLTGINFRHAGLAGADFKGVRLQGADLRNADLRGAHLHFADLRGARLRHANLRGADLSHARLGPVPGGRKAPKGGQSADDIGKFPDTPLLPGGSTAPPPCYPGCKGADLSGADLIGADLSYADLSYADLTFANLSGASMEHANLSGADLRWTTLGNLDMNWANLTGANLSFADFMWTVADYGVTWTNATCPNGMAC